MISLGQTGSDRSSKRSAWGYGDCIAIASLFLMTLRHWQEHRLYLALDTTVLWNRYCMIHLSGVCCGRAVPLLWRVLEHDSATVAFGEDQGMLRKARWLLRSHPDVMLLADRGFANYQLLCLLPPVLNHQSGNVSRAGIHPFSYPIYCSPTIEMAGSASVFSKRTSPSRSCSSR